MNVVSYCLMTSVNERTELLSEDESEWTWWAFVWGREWMNVMSFCLRTRVNERGELLSEDESEWTWWAFVWGREWMNVVSFCLRTRVNERGEPLTEDESEWTWWAFVWRREWMNVVSLCLRTRVNERGEPLSEDESVWTWWTVVWGREWMNVVNRCLRTRVNERGKPLSEDGMMETRPRLLVRSSTSLSPHPLTGRVGCSWRTTLSVRSLSHHWGTSRDSPVAVNRLAPASAAETCQVSTPPSVSPATLLFNPVYSCDPAHSRAVSAPDSTTKDIVARV